jgi:L-rhamnose mutarotase
MPGTRRLVFALDLKDEPELQAEYRRHHQSVPAPVLASIHGSGIVSMQIYHLRDRLFMIMEVDEGFSLERKAAEDLANPDVQAWEALMWRFQQALPGTAPGGKWQLMEKIFETPPTATDPGSA